jgi:uncharacterized protein (DUF1684 family)
LPPAENHLTIPIQAGEMYDAEVGTREPPPTTA